MAFKGTERRSASDIAEEIEAVGGELNAATSLETTAYFARVLKADVGLALDILADILQIPRYAAGRAGARARGDPAGDRRHPRQPGRDRLRAAAGRGVPGAGHRPADPRHRARASASFTAADLRTFLESQLRRQRAWSLSAAGKVDHAELVRHAEAQFGGHEWRRGGPIRAGTLCRGHAHLGQAVRAEPSRHGVRRAVLSGPRVLYRPGVLRAVRRGHVVAAVPGGARAPRPLLCDLFELLGAGRHGAVRHPCGDRAGDDGEADRRRGRSS